MNNLKVLLTLFVVCALSSTSSASVFREQTLERAEGGADGRGTGNGITGPVYEIFFAMAKELSKIHTPNSPSEVNDFPNSGSELPSLYNVDALLDVDAISELISGNHILVESDSSAVFTSSETSYAYYDGVLYLNSAYWDQKLLKGNAEIDVIAIILRVTGHEDKGNALAKKLADFVKNKTSAKGPSLGVDSRDAFDVQGVDSRDEFKDAEGVDSRDAFKIQF